MKLGGLTAARRGGIAGDAGSDFVGGLAQGLAIPAELQIGLAVAELQAVTGIGHVLPPLSTVEFVGGFDQKRPDSGRKFHPVISFLGGDHRLPDVQLNGQ